MVQKQSFARWAFVVLTLLCLAVSTSAEFFSHGRNLFGWSQKKSAVKNDDGYKTLVTVNGAGFRALIPIAILETLEGEIKDSITLTNQKKGSVEKNAPVLLADYIDCFAGQSTGSWIALYLASKGVGGTFSSGTLKDQAVIDEYGQTTPGTAKALRVFFYHYASSLYVPYPTPPASAPVAPAPVAPTPAAPAPTPSPGESAGIVSSAVRRLQQDPPPSVPTFTNSGLFAALGDLLGDLKLSDLKTSALVQTFDLVSRYSRVYYHNEMLTSDLGTGYSTSSRREGPPDGSEGVESGIEFTEEDYYVLDIAVGSACAPAALPAAKVANTDGEGNSLLVEGTLYFSQEILPSVVHFARLADDATLESLAVLSIGAGYTVRNFTGNKNGGLQQWVLSRDLVAVATDITAEIQSKQVEFFMYSNPKVKSGQFLRVQRFADPGTDEGKLLQSVYDYSKLSDLSDVGNKLSGYYLNHLTYFVTNFVVA